MTCPSTSQVNKLLHEAIRLRHSTSCQNMTAYAGPCTTGLWICVADPLRLGHEETYYPGNLNFKCADVIDINKANTAPKVSIRSNSSRHLMYRSSLADNLTVSSIYTL